GASPALRRLLWCLVASHTAAATPGTSLDLSATEFDDILTVRLTAETARPLLAERAARAGRSLLERLVQDLGGEVQVSGGSGARVHTVCSVPLNCLRPAPETKSVVHIL
ncbi:MAG: hypothetical protein AAF281_17115, partial [Pseudomonadota bacterium]